MKPVTTGPGVSGTFADDLETLICDLRTASGTERWQLYIQVTRSPQYSLRVYAPDGHTEPYTIIKTLDTTKEIRALLLNETESWKARSRAAVALGTDGLLA
jgi:hypothetical protein